MRRYWLSLFLLFVSTQVFAQDSISSDILSRVNQTRQSMGIAPLVFNADLQVTAQNHSNDMASVDVLSHVGTDGSQFWERMQSAGYNLSTGAENVLSRSDTVPESVYNQWFNSDPHRINMLNADYVEVGIAYARAESGRFYFTMVLGARANFTAPTITPIPRNTIVPTTIPPTATNIPTIAPTFTTAPTIPATATAIPTMPASSTPIPLTATATIFETQAPVLLTNTPQPTATEFILPDIRLIYDQDSLLLVNISGTVLNLANLVFESNTGSMPASRWNTEFLSQPLSGFTNGDCLQVWGLGVDYLVTPNECRHRHGWIAVPDSNTFWRDTDSFTVRNGEDLVGICLMNMGFCDVNISRPIEDITVLDPATFGQLPDLRFEYSDSSFALINVAGRNLDLTGLVFRSGSGTLAIETWNTQFLSQALNNFTDGDCLQAWTSDYPNQASPASCDIRHAWILANDSGDFWRQTDNFTVERDGILIGRCFTNQSPCTVSLSNNFGETTSSQTNTASSNPTQIVSTSNTGYDVQLVITPESASLINTSGENLDLSGLVFVGELGTFSASRWQTSDLSTSLATFPAGDCVQVWVLGALNQPAPATCAIRHGWIVSTQSELFWIGANTFEVWNNDQLIATCEARVTTCNFNLQ